ncbi:three-helix bundle dimerization domain-containing protein [Rhodococcus sp. LB1]|uniref:three-helix bundle dimerization domain-containing protein n=1 Tax=Rhodococcus sp. LB1 TaxID=1807499 RepID=UPI00077B0321|nr:hypothetical protein [Rhodococcus sp. LB1]KXX55311.1 hypothetical protein AZG88_19610 [Rhodococcus sp. LB1]
MDDREEHDIGVVQIRLMQRYPDLGPEVVEDLIEATLGRFEGCRIRDFVPLLVERAATRALDAAYRRPVASAAPVRTPELPATPPTESAVPATIGLRGARRIFIRRSPRPS